jgi:hypothetical protein
LLFTPALLHSFSGNQELKASSHQEKPVVEEEIDSRPG